jgi:hypothetical protein
MIIYNPFQQLLIKERIKQGEQILNRIPVKYCFISGSFLFKKGYNDIDVFVVSRSKKKIATPDNINLLFLDFNELYSLFYHSISKVCIAKNILPVKLLKVTISDYWEVINEAIPNILNQKDRFTKEIRSLVLYNEFFLNNEILDTYQLDNKIKTFRNFEEIKKYIKNNIPYIINKRVKYKYIKRFFYTQAGYYKDSMDYDSVSFLYELSHDIIKAGKDGELRRIQEKDKRDII